MESDKIKVYKYCLVPMCTNTTKTAPKKLFFLVPRKADVRRKWCKIIKRDEIKNPKLSSTTPLYVCEDHFDVEKDTENFIQYQVMTVQKGIPVSLRLKTDVLPHKFECQKQSKPVTERTAALKRQNLRLVQEAIQVSAEAVLCKKNREASTSEISCCEAGPSTSLQCTSNINNEKILCDKAIQVDIVKNKIVKYRSKGVNVKISSKSMNVSLSPLVFLSKNASTSPFKAAKISCVKRKLFPANKDVLSLASTSSLISTDYEVESGSSETSWSQDDDGDKKFKNLMRSGILTAINKEPKMLIGLPKSSYELIKILSDTIPAPVIDILITLKKIKLNDSFNILALHFGYSQSNISRIFSKTVSILAEKMKELIVWPEPSEIVKHLAISFRARYSKVVSIIDCLEIQIEKPSNAVNQALTWSQYKKCNTLKYLISCTPDGTVNFISEGYGGRASDIIIVQNCGYLDCLPPNVAVMADRGFKDLTRMLESRKCTLIRPPSVFQATSSSKEDVKQSKRIAALRIHIERVINRLREFHMLLPHACVHHSLIPIVDEVIIIACGLINMQDVLIKK